MNAAKRWNNESKVQRKIQIGDKNKLKERKRANKRYKKNETTFTKHIHNQISSILLLKYIYISVVVVWCICISLSITQHFTLALEDETNDNDTHYKWIKTAYNNKPND